MTSTNGPIIPGMANLGNTCYVNACLQCCFATFLPEVINDIKNVVLSFDKSKLENPKEKKVLVPALVMANQLINLDDYRKQLIKKGGKQIIVPRSFINGLHHCAKLKNRDSFTGFDQNDAPELLDFLIELIHDLTQRSMHVSVSINAKNKISELDLTCINNLANIHKKEHSYILENVFGLETNHISDERGKTLSIHPSLFSTLMIPTQNCKNVQECIDKYFTIENLTGDNKYEVEKKSGQKYKVNAVSERGIWQAPKYLLVVTKQYDVFRNHLAKNRALLKSSNNIKITLTNFAKEIVEYKLVSQIEHSGDVYGGHYTATILSNGRLINCNDSKVREIDEWPNNGYCFFYKR